ncbi:uncharacterized protein LOC132559621 [Ylistrum balloti]|uniref:uncharacterized protein LOC132559621 n=1 Tax=Ylistrum balloti TaxID=509963 RepID=UPI002905C504|nr:uncharacterized protein LOC132559621 [Ylistrum balloti]
MDMFSKGEMNNALLGMYVGTRGPKTLRKCITDKLFTYQMWKNEETIRKNLDPEMVLLVFPESIPVSSLDELDDLIVPDISSLAFSLPKSEQDISKLRNQIQGILEGSIFRKYLQSREQQFRRKNNKMKLLSRIQFAKLYPTNGESNIHELDISLLCFVLFEGMGFRPISDFDKLPSLTVVTEADDMLRIKICRNVLVHQANAEMNDEDFDKYWECLTGAFERLLKNTSIRRESERLKSLRLPDEKIEQFKTTIEEWRRDEQDERKEHLEQMKDIVTRTSVHTNSVIQATGTQIIDNQIKQHEKLVKLLKKSRSKQRKVQNKDLKKSFPLRVHGYDKFKQLCHIMQEAGIKYSVPTASSTDTALTSDSSSSLKDRGVLHFEVDSEDAVDNLSLNFRRSRSLPRYRPKKPNDNVWTVTDTTHNNLNSSLDSVTNVDKESSSRQARQCKRRSSEHARSSQENRSPRPGNSIRMGVRSFKERKLTVCDPTISVEDADVEHDSAGEDSTIGLYPTTGAHGHISRQSDQCREGAEDIGDPTGYFLSLQRRDEYIHSNTDTHHPAQKVLGNVVHVVQTRTKCSPTNISMSNLENDGDSTSLSATSGEYVLGEENEELTNHVSVAKDKSRLSSIKSGMYSEDSTGYNTDLLTLNCSVDGNTSSDTLLFIPVRLPKARRSPGLNEGWPPWMAENGEQIYRSSITPRSIPNTTDDGYASNSYFSSLDRKLIAPQDQYGTGFQENVNDNAEMSFKEREKDDTNSHDMGSVTSSQAPEAETLLKLPSRKTRKGFSIRNCFRRCILCGGKGPEGDQESQVVKKDHYRKRRESERCLLSSRVSNDFTATSRRINSVQLSEAQISTEV